MLSLYALADAAGMAEKAGWDENGTPFADASPPADDNPDERRMQLLAFDLWNRLLGQDQIPVITNLEPSGHPLLSPFAVLLDMSTSREDPKIVFLGQSLADECGVSCCGLNSSPSQASGVRDPGSKIPSVGGARNRGAPSPETPRARASRSLRSRIRTARKVSELPAQSLLAHIAELYLAALVAPVPLGFETECINQRGRIVLCRGILLPFTRSCPKVDFVFGVINWKEAVSGRKGSGPGRELSIPSGQGASPARQDRPVPGSLAAGQTVASAMAATGPDECCVELATTVAPLHP